MVTGVETAGLVLATFPIVVSGLSHFAEGVDTIKSWRRYRRQLTNYARTLEAEYVIYRNTVEELLDGIIHSDEELNMLLEDPGGLCWQKPQYEDQLRRRLDHSYPSYLVTMTDILTAVQAVQKKLGLGDSGKVRAFNELRTLSSAYCMYQSLTPSWSDRFSGTHILL